VATSRETFLERVRQAVRAGQRAGAGNLPGPRTQVGYQGAGTDPVARYCQEFQAAGGHVHVVPDPSAAVARVRALLTAAGARRLVVGGGRLLATLDLRRQLHDLGIEVAALGDLTPSTSREVFFAADVGLTGADFLVAETGSIVLRSGPQEPRSASLLPPVHVVVADQTQIVADLFDLFVALGGPTAATSLPSCTTIITGPSKTGDIELRLVTGVHGPGEVHCILIAPPH
jgi:L-lactate utilization protein LutC